MPQRWLKTKNSKMKYTMVLSVLLYTSSLSAQSIIYANRISEAQSTLPITTPVVLNLERFKANVPSLVIKANPFTLPFKYIDAGIEYRNQRSGWTLMNHSYFGYGSDIRALTYNGIHVITAMFVRFEASKRWYRTQQSMFRFDQERFTGIYVMSGYANTRSTTTFEMDPADFPVPVGPFTDGVRIDLILGAEFGKTRNLAGSDHPMYYETSWKLGYNLSNKLPHVLWGFRLNYKVN